MRFSAVQENSDQVGPEHPQLRGVMVLRLCASGQQALRSPFPPDAELRFEHASCRSSTYDRPLPTSLWNSS